MKRELRVGISGWRYPGWHGKFYPKDLPQQRELEFASGAFNSVEINGSFLFAATAIALPALGRSDAA